MKVLILIHCWVDFPKSNRGGKGNDKGSGKGTINPQTSMIASLDPLENNRSEMLAFEKLEQCALALYIHWHHQTRIQIFTNMRNSKIQTLQSQKVRLQKIHHPHVLNRLSFRSFMPPNSDLPEP